MNTVQKNNTITKKQVQEILEKNQGKLRISDKNLKKLVKSMRSNTISRQMRKVFYQECLKKIEREEEPRGGKFKHLTLEDRISIEIFVNVNMKMYKILNLKMYNFVQNNFNFYYHHLVKICLLIYMNYH